MLPPSFGFARGIEPRRYAGSTRREPGREAPGWIRAVAGGPGKWPVDRNVRAHVSCGHPSKQRTTEKYSHDAGRAFNRARLAIWKERHDRFEP